MQTSHGANVLLVPNVLGIKGSAETDGTFLWVVMVKVKVMVWLFGVKCLCSERIQVEDPWRCGVDFTCLCETRTVSRHQCRNLSMRILSHRISFATFTFLHHSSRSWELGLKSGNCDSQLTCSIPLLVWASPFPVKIFISRLTPAVVASSNSITVDVPNFRKLLLQTHLKSFQCDVCTLPRCAANYCSFWFLHFSNACNAIQVQAVSVWEPLWRYWLNLYSFMISISW